MPFQPFNTLTSRIIPVPIDHIDTDRIIPARFLKSVGSAGFGSHLFHDWRYLPDGTPDPAFILNQPAGRGEILLAGPNFGCGSSREHAAWAILQFGFRVVISSGFADIFRNNALNNGLLPLEVTPTELDFLLEVTQCDPSRLWTVNLPDQVLCPNPHEGGEPLPGMNKMRISFEINSLRKWCLLNGTDLVDYLVSIKPGIEKFEMSRAGEEGLV